MDVNDFERLLASAKKGNWDFFEQVSDDVRKRVEIEGERTAEERRTICAAWARFAETPDGRKALDALFDMTLRRTVFFVNLNVPPDQAAAWGFFREGQNALALAIAKAIAEGAGDDPPKPRDVT